jgi:hypothetical protein
MMIPEMFDTLAILNLHYFKRDSYIIKLMPSHLGMEGSDLVAETHLADARSQNTGTGISGISTKDDRGSLGYPFFI